MNTLLLGILIIGGTGFAVCGGLYLLFKFLDSRNNDSWRPIINNVGATRTNTDNISFRSHDIDTTNHDTYFASRSIGSSNADWD